MKYKIAVASSEGAVIDTHFGHADHFTIFEVDEETGDFEDVETRDVSTACGGGSCASVGAETARPAAGSGCAGPGCGNHAPEDSPMDAIAKSLSDVDYVLVARIGIHAIRALAKYNVTAYDIVLPVDEAIEKINGFRKKQKARAELVNQKL